MILSIVRQSQSPWNGIIHCCFMQTVGGGPWQRALFSIAMTPIMASHGVAEVDVLDELASLFFFILRLLIV